MLPLPKYVRKLLTQLNKNNKTDLKKFNMPSSLLYYLVFQSKGNNLSERTYISLIIVSDNFILRLLIYYIRSSKDKHS